MRRIIAALGTVGIVLVALAGTASAHVTISPSSAAKGSFAVLTFKVPNEKDNASTTKLQVKFPDDHPIAEALVQPVPGWTADVQSKKLPTPIKNEDGDEVTEAVDTLTWTASGKGIDVGQFQEFAISVALPSDADALEFPTVQTYSDGSMASWVQQTPANGPEPENPAPSIKLTTGGDDAMGSTPTTAPAATTTAKTASKSDVDGAKTLAIVALAIGAVGLLAGLGGFAKGRRKA